FRLRSRSSSLMRLFASRLCWAETRSSGASLSAAVALSFHCCNSVGYTPFSRHQALRCASSIAAVAITACSRAAAVHTRSRLGADRASARHLSRVATDTPVSWETCWIGALSGGSSRATARSLNACPYRATSSPHAPRLQIYRGGNYSDTRGEKGGAGERRNRDKSRPTCPTTSRRAFATQSPLTGLLRTKHGFSHECSSN